MSFNIQELVNKVEQAKKDIRNVVSENIWFLAEESFKAHPEIESIGVHGYTPGFNDGEPCYHSLMTDVGSLEFSLDKSKLENPEEYEELTGSLEDELYDTSFDKKIENCPHLKQFSDNLDILEDTLEEIYSTNQTITFHRDGTITTDYYDCGY